MQLSTRNTIKGKVTELKEGMVMAAVKVDIGNGNILTSVISTEAAKELGIKAEEEVQVLIKATNVILAK